MFQGSRARRPDRDGLHLFPAPLWLAFSTGVSFLQAGIPEDVRGAGVVEDRLAAVAPNWRVVAGRFQGQPGWLEARPGGPEEACVLELEPSVPDDFVLQIRWRLPGRGTIGISYRRGAGPGAWPDGYYVHSLGAGRLRAVAKIKGAYSELWSQPGKLAALVPGNEVVLSIVVTGRRHLIYIDGRNVGEFEDDSRLSGGIALTFAHGEADPRAAFRDFRLNNVLSERLPPRLSRAQRRAATLRTAQAAFGTEKEAAKGKLLAAAEAVKPTAYGELGNWVARAHAMLRRYFYEPRTGMVYTIIEPRTGRVVLPTPAEVGAGLPNANGWSTPIEDCAGYGNGRYLAWLCSRFEVTRDPRHARRARDVLAGALACGRIRPADASGFAEIVRGVLPDNRTFYPGKGKGSSGDNANGYFFGLWSYARGLLATAPEKEAIASVVRRSCYRNPRGAFAGMAWSLTGDASWRRLHQGNARAAALSAAACVTTREEPSWTAVQRQLHWRALADLSTDPATRESFRHALLVNAWGRADDLLAGLEFDVRRDDYLHRVRCVRNPMDAMLTIMLSGDGEVIRAALPVFCRVAAGIDPSGLWDQRQLTPMIGAFWLGVKQGFIPRDAYPGDLAPEDVSLRPLESGRHPVVTYFAAANPRPPSADGSRFEFPQADN